jgi:mono/diheme cytochrome c family protein
MFPALFHGTSGCIVALVSQMKSSPEENRDIAKCAPARLHVELGFVEKPMWKRATLTCVVFCFGLLGCQKKSVTEPQISLEEVNRKNPIDSNPASIAEGQRLYHATDCALCHGKDGEGRGVLAKDVSMNTHDWRNAASLEHFTDGELFFIIVKGKGRMPAYESRETPEQVWQMIEYLHSMAGNQSSPKS